MNKIELKKLLAEESGLTQADAGRFLDALTVVVISALSDGGDVNLLGIGKLHTKYVAEKVGRNPKTGESIRIPGHNAPKFKPARSLMDAI